MNPQTQENLNEYHLQKLVTDVDSDSVEAEIVSLPILPTSKFNYAGITEYTFNTINWFLYLPALTKLIVLAVLVLLGFAILQAALKLIASAISMALFAGLVYLGYNFFVAGNSSHVKE